MAQLDGKFTARDNETNVDNETSVGILELSEGYFAMNYATVSGFGYSSSQLEYAIIFPLF